MIEFLDYTVVWWYWIVAGLLLIILEISTGTFITLGLGLAALLVGFLDLIFPMSLVAQLSIWIVSSIGFIMIFFKWFKHQKTVSNTGQSSYNFDTLGVATSDIDPHKRGNVRFDTPVLGSTVWTATSEESLTKDTRIRIIEVNGQLITVASIPTNQ